MAYNPLNPNGQATKANSQPVVLASDQDALPITDNGGSLTVDGAVTANAGTNLNTSALALDATLSTTNTEIGGLTETAPTTDTASSGLNGRLQRIAQRITSLITALGSPFQAGGSIGNTSFGVTQATGTNLHVVTDATSVTTATLSAETTKVIGTVNQGTSPWVVSGTVTTQTSDITPSTQNITVVDSSSSSAGGANNQTIIIGTPTAGSAASFALSSIETIRVEVTGIWTGTIATETSIDGGTTWVNQGVHQGAYTTSSFTLGFVGGCNVAGATNFRVRATAAITGTVVVKVVESINTQSVYIANAAPAGNVVSVSNSSVATLTSGSVFTGVSEDVSNFSEMRISVFSDVASATDGLSVQQSSNGTNWDVTDTYTVSLSAAGGGKTYVVPRSARFFRVVYTNGGTNQVTFRLQSILNRTATAPSSQRATDGYTNETDLVQGQSFLMGYNGGTWDRIRVTATGILNTVLTAGTAVIGKVGIDQTTPGTTNLVALAANQSVNVAQINGVPPLMGNGATGTGSQRVTIASDNTAFAVNATLSAETTKVIGTVNVASAQTIGVTQATGSNLHTVLDSGTLTTLTTLTGTTTLTPGTGATNLGKAEDAAHSSGDVGVAILGVRNTTLTDLSAGNTDGDYEPFQVNKAGAMYVTGAPSSTSGWLVATGSISNTKTDIGTANTPGNVGGWYIFNGNAATAYIQFFNAQASAVTLGTTAPVYSLGIPAGAGANVAPGMVGITHATAISIAITTTRAGSTANSSTVDYNIWYKQ